MAALDFYHFVQLLLFCGKTGQIAYALSPSSGIAKKNTLARHTAEALPQVQDGVRVPKHYAQPPYLVYSTADFRTPVWCRSVYNRLIDSLLYDALHIVI